MKIQIAEQLNKIYSESEAKAIEQLLLDFIEEQDNTDQIHAAERVLRQVVDQTPVQYIIGKTWFSDFEVMLNEHVLIPRPETDELVHWILQEEQSERHNEVWDIGTGSGCIALALKRHAPNWQVMASDSSEKSLACAQANAERLGLQIQWHLHDILLDPYPGDGKLDIIVSNPPYILKSEKIHIDAHVLLEPHAALFVPEDDPLIFYKKIEEWGQTHLTEQGKIYFEVHSAYAIETEKMLQERGWTTELRKDMHGNWRMLCCIR